MVATRRNSITHKRKLLQETSTSISTSTTTASSSSSLVNNHHTYTSPLSYENHLHSPTRRTLPNHHHHLEPQPESHKSQQQQQLPLYLSPYSTNSIKPSKRLWTKRFLSTRHCLWTAGVLILFCSVLTLMQVLSTDSSASKTNELQARVDELIKSQQHMEQLLHQQIQQHDWEVQLQQNQAVPQTSLDYWRHLLQNISDPQTLYNPRTPQYVALDWLLNDVFSQNYIAHETSVHHQVVLKERYILLVLYFATKGSDWSQHCNWLQANTHHCDWKCGFGGVYCTVMQDHLDDPALPRVTELRLKGSKHHALVGSDPAGRELAHLQELRLLDLHHNQLKGPLPEALPPNLQYLDWSENRANGEIPTKWKEATQLIHVDVGRNDLRGTLPANVIGEWTQLTHLDMEANVWQGPLPALERLTNLQYLELSRNALSGTLPESYASLESLKVLHLSHNHLSGTVPPGLLNRTLEDLRLYVNPRMQLPAHLAQAPLPNQGGLRGQQPQILDE